MGIHDGHRERMKQEFLDSGLEHFSEVRALELLLFFCRPQGDVNPLAHRLLDTFGSLAGVLEAQPEALMAVSGVGTHVAALLRLIPELSTKYLVSRRTADVILSDASSLYDLFFPYFFGARDETVFLGCFDAKLKLLGVRKISAGMSTATDISTRQVASAALSLNAAAVVLAHNHPSGVAKPSDEDVSTTRYLSQFLRGMGVVLYDHVIFADGDMVSFRESGYMLAFST